ncbi:DNA polymerase-3 subunit beta [Lachnospiraceae bacterium]|nr:DNA polymerase-3 subunit beta [Lachnospiraceae bacterium]
MKISCSKADLVNGVSIVSKAVPSKTTMDILQCILIIASNGIIKLTANDTELGIETQISGTIEENGIIALDAKLFNDIVRRLPDGEVKISTDSSLQTQINCMKAKFNLPGKSGENFPYLPDVDRSDSIAISEFSLKEIILQTIFSISDNENNKLMTGELFEITGDKLRVVALDGHRVSIRNIELRADYGSKKVVVPGKTLSDISKILSGDTEKEVQLYFMQNYIAFEFDDTLVVSRIIEGEYFNVDQMLTTSYGTKVVVNKREFLDSIDRATLLIKDGDKKPAVISINDDFMKLKIKSAIGTMDEDIDISKEGQDLMIGFNPKFLIDALRAIGDEKISMYLVNAKAPCFIRDEEGKYIYIVLPVNFNSMQ